LQGPFSTQRAEMTAQQQGQEQGPTVPGPPQDGNQPGQPAASTRSETTARRTRQGQGINCGPPARHCAMNCASQGASAGDSTPKATLHVMHWTAPVVPMDGAARGAARDDSGRSGSKPVAGKWKRCARGCAPWAGEWIKPAGRPKPGQGTAQGKPAVPRIRDPLGRGNRVAQCRKGQRANLRLNNDA